MEGYDADRQIIILQAAQEGDLSLIPNPTDEDLKTFDEYVEWLDELRRENGGTLAGLDIDLPYD